ncbi:MAG: oligosaccharide flippase family protein [Bacteroidetes bacterium]|jgi:O-antigen/teichoic acid export membrane protein|nr:oligosaccharide flippase family protein [Bacteroidota bacterium]
MKELRDLLGRSALLAGARVVSKIATLVVVLSVARRLSLEEFGLLGTMLAFSTFAGLISDFGMLLPTLRGMSQQSGREASIVGRTLWPRLTWGIVAAASLMAGGFIMGYPMATLGLFVAASLAESAFTMLVRAHEVPQAMRRVTAFVIAERVSYAVWVLSALTIRPTLGAVAGASLASIAIMLLVAFRTFRRHYGWSWPPFSWRIIREGTVQGLPLLLAGLLSTIYYRLDIVLLEQLVSPTEAGVYNAAMRVVEALMFIPLSMMSTVFPLLASSFDTDASAFRASLRRAAWLLAAAGALVGGFLVLWGPWLVELLFGPTFVRSGVVLQILGPMLFFYFLNFLASQAVVAMRRDRVLVVVTGAAALVATMLNAVLIPQFGAVSSAAVRVGVEAAMAAGFGWMIIQTLRSKRGDQATVTNGNSEATGTT